MWQSPDIHEVESDVLRLSMLGPVEVWMGERRLDITAPQTLAVLAILAAEPGRTLSTTQLAARLWADQPPTSAANVLRNHVHGMRRQFDAYGHAGAGAEWLGSTLGGYRLGLPVESDVGQVERLIAAAEADRSAGAAEEANEKLAAAQQLWRGDPLIGLPGPWAEKERARLDGLRAALGEATISVALDLGRYPAAVAELEALVRAEPHGERWHELLMVALYRAGRRVDALEVYRNARRLLADELGLEPGPRMTRLHQQILSAEPPIVAGESRSPDSEFHSPRIPAQLPPDVADFVGREDLVQELTEALSANCDRRQAVAITGMGGIGKTTLAIHLAHRVRDHYPDGVLYLDLGGMDEQPREADTLIEVASRSFGVELSELSLDPAERTSLWRELIASRRVLLVLDNAHNVDQLAPLLPSTGQAGVVVTSRSSLAEMFDARLVPLDVLTPDEAWMLLERMVSARRLAQESDAAHEILRQCGYLPVSLRTIGARLASRPAWTLAAVAERLAEGRDRLAELVVGNICVEEVFQTSYRRLDPELSRAFVLIGFCDAPHLSVAAIAALLDRDRTAAERLCETLVDSGMLQTSELGRYRQHDLLRLFARGVADAALRRERPQALHRLVDFYLASAKNLVELRDPGMGTDHYAVTSSAGQRFTDERHCAAWVAAERSGLVALYRQVADHPDARTRTLAVDLALAVVIWGDAGEHTPEVAQAVEALGRTAGNDGDGRTLARAQLAAAGARLIGAGDPVAARTVRTIGGVLHDVGDVVGAILAEQVLSRATNLRGPVEGAEARYRRAPSGRAAGTATCS
ncbi:AfsR/SARP family transcriptional regulator [Nocardia albiluteola]|nr:BTAD domain-containing putative transcriptional regulator [Nocardia albiluteola]